MASGMPFRRHSSTNAGKAGSTGTTDSSASISAAVARTVAKLSLYSSSWLSSPCARPRREILPAGDAQLVEQVVEHIERHDGAIEVRDDRRSAGGIGSGGVSKGWK